MVQALLATAALIAGCFAASGLWFERRAACPLPWASLAASVPVLTLAVGYARVAEFHPRAGWAAFGVLLAAGLTGRRCGGAAGGQPRAGRHPRRRCCGGLGARLRHAAAGPVADADAVAAAAGARLGGGPGRVCRRCGAWRSPSPALVLVRLLLNGYVLDYGFGRWPVANGLLAAYALPAVAFALAATMFRRQRDDLTVGVLEAGSVALATAFVALEIRHAVGPEEGLHAAAFGFPEAALDVASLAVLAVVTMRIARRLGGRCCTRHGGCWAPWRWPAGCF